VFADSPDRRRCYQERLDWSMTPGLLVRERWIERIAREICKRDGYDPESKVSPRNGDLVRGHVLVTDIYPAWHLYRPEARAAYDTLIEFESVNDLKS
jgi:hypothetical protein